MAIVLLCGVAAFAEVNGLEFPDSFGFIVVWAGIYDLVKTFK